MLFSFLCLNSVCGQNWNFSKEKDGIKLFTGLYPGERIKSYRGIAVINAEPSRTFAVLEDVYHTDWWDKNISVIRVLSYERNKSARYYLVYDLPWPVIDRDLCVDVSVVFTITSKTGTIIARPSPNCIPTNSDQVRITAYRQSWEVKPAENGKTLVILEGFVDPGGSIPDWISNMLIIDAPYKIIRDLKKKLE
jgi:hypothetical protein